MTGGFKIIKGLESRIYLSTLVNTFGSWFSFLAIALITKETYGAHFVAWVFLVQTLPAVLFSRGLANMIPSRSLEKFYWVIHIGLACNTMVLIFFQDLVVIFVHLFIAATLKSLSNPIFNTLIGKWIAEDGQRRVYTRVGAIQTGTLALAPAIGAWVKITYSSEVLFAVNTLTFFAATLILKELFYPLSWRSGSEPKAAKAEGFLSSFVHRPTGMTEALKKSLWAWFLFLSAGAVLNAIEFPAFERLQMSEQEIGFALGAWGLGGLGAFLLKREIKKNIIALSYVGALGLFSLSSQGWLLIGSFFILGTLSSLLAGSLRASIQASLTKDQNPMPIWAYANQVVHIINLLAYVSAGAMFSVLGFYPFAVIMTLSGLGIFLAVNEREAASLTGP